MFITIITKFHASTERRGPRISASNHDGKRAVISYPHEVKAGEACHFEAVKALCAKMGWKGEVVCGEIRPGVMAWNFVCPGNDNFYVVPNPKSV